MIFGLTFGRQNDAPDELDGGRPAECARLMSFDFGDFEDMFGTLVPLQAVAADSNRFAHLAGPYRPGLSAKARDAWAFMLGLAGCGGSGHRRGNP